MATRFPRPTPLGLLLVCALALAALLAFEAQDAVRSHRATTERALRDYASVAAWTMADAARVDIASALATTFAPVAKWKASSPFEVLPPLSQFDPGPARATLCGESAQGFAFRVDLREKDAVVVDGKPADAATRAMLADVSAHGRNVYQPEWTFAALGAVPGGRPAVIYAVRYAEHRAPIAAYGFSVCEDAIAGPLFHKLFARRALLPRESATAATNDSLLDVSVTDVRGKTLFASSRETPTSAEVRLEQIGPVVIRASIRPESAGLLLAGSLPRSRVPILIGLLVLTAGMIGVALTQLHRDQELSRLRAEFISSVSHDLRTPLSQILLFAETLSLGRARTDAERRNAADVIVEEGRRLMHLVDNVLHVSRTERQMARLSTAPLRLADVVAQTVGDWRPLGRRAGVEVELESDVGIVAMADPGAIRQILINLLDNAAKYGPRGQVVRVSLRRVKDEARIDVVDEGQGIPLGERERIWESFYRLDRDATSSVAGSGIGLFVVRELARLHGGDAWMETAEKGSRFIVAIPLDHAPQPSPTGRFAAKG